MKKEGRRSHMVAHGPQEDFIIPILKREMKRFLAIIQPTDTKNSVIDIGCGNQPLRSALEEDGWIYFSLDIAQNEKKNIDYISAIDQNLSLNREFDLVICMEVLEHVLDWNKSFENLKKLCSPQGKLIITCPFIFPLHEAPFDYWRPTSHSIEAMAMKFGFKVLQFQRGGNGFDVLGTIFNSFYLSRKETTLLGKIKFEIFYRAFLFLKKQFASKGVEKYATTEGTWYLSNIFLFERV